MSYTNSRTKLDRCERVRAAESMPYMAAIYQERVEAAGERIGWGKGKQQCGSNHRIVFYGHYIKRDVTLPRNLVHFVKNC